MQKRDTGVAVFLEVEAYDLGTGMVTARPRSRPDMKLEIPLQDAVLMCLSTDAKERVLVDGSRPATLLFATKTWALLTNEGADQPVVVEIERVTFLKPSLAAAE